MKIASKKPDPQTLAKNVKIGQVFSICSELGFYIRTTRVPDEVMKGFIWATELEKGQCFTIRDTCYVTVYPNAELYLNEGEGE